MEKMGFEPFGLAPKATCFTTVVAILSLPAGMGLPSTCAKLCS